MDYILSCRCSAALPCYAVHTQYFPVDLMDLLFNQEKKFYNSTLADLETSYHLLTSIYYKNSLNLTMSLVTKYYPDNV
jgi:hypothetical protein